jgi:hypothetical protein
MNEIRILLTVKEIASSGWRKQPKRPPSTKQIVDRRDDNKKEYLV